MSTGPECCCERSRDFRELPFLRPLQAGAFLAHDFFVEAQILDLKRLRKLLVGEQAFVIEHNRINVNGDESRETFHVHQLVLQFLYALRRGKTCLIEKLFRFLQGFEKGKVEKRGMIPRPVGLLLFPAIVAGNEGLQLVIERAQAREDVQKRDHEDRAGKDLIDEWEDVEREVDGELPTILHGKTFLVAEDFITDRVARYVGFVKCPHQKLIETGLYGQGFFVGGMNCVADQRIVERNEVAAGTIERIAKAASFSGES